MAVTWTKFHPLILPHVGPCPKSVVNAHLAEAAADFCAKTYLWRERIDPEATLAGEARYELIGSGVLEDVLWLTVDGREIHRTQDSFVPPSQADQTGTPQAFAIVGDREVRLYPTPDKAYIFTGDVVVKPSRTARGVEDFLYETYARAIVDGALYRLLSIPEKEWTNLPLAEIYLNSFNRGVTKARVRDYRRVPIRVKPQPF